MAKWSILECEAFQHWIIMPSKPTQPTCLIGEADPFLARLLQRFAETNGLRIQRAQTGENLLSLARSGQPAVIVLDPELPGKLRGWEALQALRAGSEPHPIPVILCSWLVASQAQSLAGQPYPHLQKPDLHFEDFTAALNMAGIRIMQDSDKDSKIA
jgi:CheY-like chemotaxis protein